MADLDDLFPGFDQGRLTVGDAEIFYRVGGSGPPLVLLHGYPQTHAAWSKIAGELAARFTLVLPDLRGYGRSRGPAADAAHLNYSKRTMAGDVRQLMKALGHDRFALGGHDRGARVAYRLALDTPEAVSELLILDVVPTIDVWQAMAAPQAIKSYHWPFLAQPSPMPETLIAGAPVAYTDHTLASWSATRDLSPFPKAALDDYRALLSTEGGRTAVTEDYRAGATCDWEADAEDRREGNRIATRMLVLWGEDYLPAKAGAGPLDIWRRWADDLTGAAINCGHFLAEERPTETLRAILAFFDGAIDDESEDPIG